MTAQRPTLLIVDDDRDFVASVTAYLEHHGYRVCHAFDGAAALRLARRERPALILMDIMMGERTEGFFAIQNLRHDATLATVPVLVLSALYGQPAGSRVPDPTAQWLAHDGFLAKPVDLPRLLDRIRDALHEAPVAPGAAGEAP